MKVVFVHGALVFDGAWWWHRMVEPLATLGLVYSVEAKDGRVRVDMTLTEVGCIFTHRVFSAVYDAIEALTGVKEVEVVPRWTPVWTEERLNQKARAALEGSRTAMFRTIKRRSLDAYDKSEWRREILRADPRDNRVSPH